MIGSDHPDDPRHVEPDADGQGPCGRCGRDADDPVHDPFAAGSGATAEGHPHLPAAPHHPKAA